MKLLEYTFREACPPRAFSTQRQDGVGEGAYASFNITHYCGDSAENVRANRRILCAELGITDERLVLPRQTHSDNIAIVTLETPSEALEGVDAVITHEEGLCIGVSTADCIPLLYFDAQHRVVAAVHAGWRGTAQDIVRHTLHAMQQHYGTQPCDVQAGIGPCIGQEAYEVGDEVVTALHDAGYNLEAIARRNPTTGKMHIDLAAANADSLLRCGVDLMNIEVCGICTHRNSDTFYSVRALGTTTGRFLTGVMMK